MDEESGKNRRKFLQAMAAGSAAAMLPSALRAADPVVSTGTLSPELRNLVERYGKPPKSCKKCVVGTQEWQLMDPAENREIEGYASAPSVDLDEQICFYVNVGTRDRRGWPASYKMEIFRLGWYGGKGGLRVTDPMWFYGIAQREPKIDLETGLVECRWRSQLSLVPKKQKDYKDRWTSGMYVAKLTENATGKQSYIRFVVRDDKRKPDLLFQSSVTTDQCYNEWGGKSVYFSATGDATPAVKVSFNRPYGLTFEGTDDTHGLGVGFRWEYPMVRFLETEGYDVAYTTNVDIHRDPRQLFDSRAFLSVGHDEYWTYQMRINVESARDRGVNLGFFGANTCYWQIRFETSSYTRQSTDTIVAYRFQALREGPDDTVFDPYSEDWRRKHLTTTLWRDPFFDNVRYALGPENSLVGVMYYFNTIPDVFVLNDMTPKVDDVIVANPSHWVFDRTTLREGSRLRGLLGYEVDRVFDNGRSPRNLVVLCRSGPTPVFEGDTGAPFSDMTIYMARSGALVFATGTNQWPWGLDDYGMENSSRVDSRAQQMTRNVLDRFISTGRDDDDDDDDD